jgi:hypothetical protein
MTVIRRLSVLLAATVALTLLASSCSYFQRLDTRVMASCSVAGSNRFDLVYTDGPQLSPQELLSTPQGQTLDSFFNGGPGEVEGEGYLGADGFSIVSDGYVLGYRDSELISDFSLDGGEIGAWGGCRPVLVRGDQVASRWYLDSPANRNATIIPILVEGGACVEDGRNRVVTEIVEIAVQDEDAVLITAWTRQVDMPFMCAGIGIALDAEAMLDLPLGNRALLDAGLIPPAAPDTP